MTRSTIDNWYRFDKGAESRMSASAEMATLTGSLTGGICGFLASMIDVGFAGDGTVLALTPVLMTAAGVAVGAAIGAALALLADALRAAHKLNPA
jgi:hypothetical protein